MRLATYSGFWLTSESGTESSYRSDRVAYAENGWRGRLWAWTGGPEFDRLVDMFDTSLDKQERIRTAVQMLKIRLDDVSQINVYWQLVPQLYDNRLTGPTIPDRGTDVDWNIQDWAWTQ